MGHVCCTSSSTPPALHYYHRLPRLPPILIAVIKIIIILHQRLESPANHFHYLYIVLRPPPRPQFDTVLAVSCCSFFGFVYAVMATKWEFEYATGMGMSAEFSPVETPAHMYGMPSVEKLRIEDLLDFTNHELLLSSSSSSSAVPETSYKHLLEPQLSAAAAASDSEYIYPCRASFADGIYIPGDEVAELEWLSKFVEDSFSDVPVQSPAAEAMVQSITTHRANMPSSCRGARSKRSRGIAAAAESSAMAWSSLASSSSTTSSSSSSDFSTLNVGVRKKQEVPETGTDGATRRCTHCASEKTPQWRTGPFGPKTLCNACGVRYKSGRLVPEYRPAASPTFLLTQHSNSHRKVLELRRQKELHVRYHDNASSLASLASAAATTTTALPEMLFHDYDVC